MNYRHRNPSRQSQPVINATTRDPKVSTLRPATRLSSKPTKSSLPKTSNAWTFSSGARASSWKDVCTLGCRLDEDCKLQYFPPSRSVDGKVYAKISNSEIEQNVKRWSNTLAGFVLGERPFNNHLKACVTRLWWPTCFLEIHSRENVFSFFQFGSEDECNRILLRSGGGGHLVV